MSDLEERRAFDGLRTWVEGVIADPPRLRLYSHVALVLVGWFALLSPLSDKMRAAEASLAKAHKQANQAKSLEHLTAQREAYLPRLTGSDDVVDWQNYVLSKVDAAGVRLSTFEPYGTDQRKPYVVMNLRIAVQSQSYEQLADFTDRLEHGERLVRLEQMVIDQTASALLLTLTMRGLAMPGLEAIPLADPVAQADPLAPADEDALDEQGVEQGEQAQDVPADDGSFEGSAAADGQGAEEAPPLAAGGPATEGES